MINLRHIFGSLFKKKTVRPEAKSAGGPDMDRLAEGMRRLMEDEALFKKKHLLKSDMARELGTNACYVSACVNERFGKSFTAYVNGYRIRYAQELIKRNPGLSFSVIGEMAGFSNEVSFYQNFKAVTGKTPSEWLEK